MSEEIEKKLDEATPMECLIVEELTKLREELVDVKLEYRSYKRNKIERDERFDRILKEFVVLMDNISMILSNISSDTYEFGRRIKELSEKIK